MQLFSFHSRAVYNTLENIVGERIHSTIKKLCETIEKTCKLNSDNVAILKTNQKQLEKAYCKGARPHLESIKNVVDKYITVPNNVLLEEDKYQRTQYSDTEFESIKQKLEDLQQRAKKATILNYVLQEELEVLEQYPTIQENVDKMCNTIKNGLTCSDINEKIYQLVDDYKSFSTSIFDTTERTEKMKYNTVDNPKCIDIDLSTL
ncbi:uncharacterized protein LOC143428791 isoform X2 [Xylocopa sonorina]